jgi:hypothetical protein
MTSPIEIAAQMYAVAVEGKAHRRPHVADHHGTYDTQQRAEVNIVAALVAKGGRVTAGDNYHCDASECGPGNKEAHRRWMDGEQLLEVEVQYDRDGELANVQSLDETVGLIKEAHGHLDEDDVLVVAVLVVGWQLDGSRYLHRTVLLLDRTDGLYYDPTSLVRRRHTRIQCAGFIPYTMEALADTVEMIVTRGEADVTCQGQTTADAALCNLLSATAVAAATFAGVIGTLPVLRCLQGLSATALTDVARFGLPEAWQQAERDQDADREGSIMPHSVLDPEAHARCEATRISTVARIVKGLEERRGAAARPTRRKLQTGSSRSVAMGGITATSAAEQATWCARASARGE